MITTYHYHYYYYYDYYCFTVINLSISTIIIIIIYFIIIIIIIIITRACPRKRKELGELEPQEASQSRRAAEVWVQRCWLRLRTFCSLFSACNLVLFMLARNRDHTYTITCCRCLFSVSSCSFV